MRSATEPGLVRTAGKETGRDLASGGDGYSVFQASDDRYDTGWLLSDALAEYLQTEPRIPSVEGRITEVEAETQTSDSEDE